MIDVKIIKKPKTEGAPSARQTAGTAYGSRTVKEAAHAARADMAELAGGYRTITYNGIPVVADRFSMAWIGRLTP